jgi:hypothetical protein
MKYQIVDGNKNPVLNSIDEVEALGYKMSGYNLNTYNRAELQNQPVFAKLCGPMWSGSADVMRYETSEMNDILSR